MSHDDDPTEEFRKIDEAAEPDPAEQPTPVDTPIAARDSTTRADKQRNQRR